MIINSLNTIVNGDFPDDFLGEIHRERDDELEICLRDVSIKLECRGSVLMLQSSNIGCQWRFSGGAARITVEGERLRSRERRWI